jgi:phosphate:Na+ symporter
LLVLVGTFIGGLGLFLLAVSMITDGLRLAAGDSLRDVLTRATATPWRGLATGFGVTAVVQSSSATTVATIGFVNAGLLSLPVSLLVIYGANVGTTMTGWIVAVLGFGVDVEVWALPLIGAGMLVRVLRPGSRLAAVGEAAAGFGVFFIGVSLLSGTFSGFAAQIDVASLAEPVGLGLVLYVLAGFIMTLVTQSSSAAIAITLTAASAGLLDINASAAMVIGANVGTTSTAALAVIGATPNARRLASGHILFNLLTGVVALALLPVLLWLVRSTGSALGLEDHPAISLAGFHSVFNILGVLLMLPLNARLAQYLSRAFSSETERLSAPLYLDRSTAANPDLALAALQRELLRAHTLCRAVVFATLSEKQADQHVAAIRRRALFDLIKAIEGYVSRVELQRLPESSRGYLPVLLRTSAYLEEVVGLSGEIAVHRPDMDALLGEKAAVAEPISDYRQALIAALESADPELESFSAAELEAGYDHLKDRWHKLKAQLLEAASNRQLPLRHLNSAMEGLRSSLKVLEQLKKSAILLTADLTPENSVKEPAAELL